jgi:hypothetical protein
MNMDIDTNMDTGMDMDMNMNMDIDTDTGMAMSMDMDTDMDMDMDTDMDTGMKVDTDTGQGHGHWNLSIIPTSQSAFRAYFVFISWQNHPIAAAQYHLHTCAIWCSLIPYRSSMQNTDTGGWSNKLSWLSSVAPLCDASCTKQHVHSMSKIF